MSSPIFKVNLKEWHHAEVFEISFPILSETKRMASCSRIETLRHCRFMLNKANLTTEAHQLLNVTL